MNLRLTLLSLLSMVSLTTSPMGWVKNGASWMKNTAGYYMPQNMPQMPSTQAITGRVRSAFNTAAQSNMVQNVINSNAAQKTAKMAQAAYQALPSTQAVNTQMERTIEFAQNTLNTAMQSPYTQKALTYVPSKEQLNQAALTGIVKAVEGTLVVADVVANNPKTAAAIATAPVALYAANKVYKAVKSDAQALPSFEEAAVGRRVYFNEDKNTERSFAKDMPIDLKKGKNPELLSFGDMHSASLLKSENQELAQPIEIKELDVVANLENVKQPKEESMLSTYIDAHQHEMARRMPARARAKMQPRRAKTNSDLKTFDQLLAEINEIQKDAKMQQEQAQAKKSINPIAAAAAQVVANKVEQDAEKQLYAPEEVVEIPQPLQPLIEKYAKARGSAKFEIKQEIDALLRGKSPRVRHELLNGIKNKNNRSALQLCMDLDVLDLQIFLGRFSTNANPQ